MPWPTCIPFLGVYHWHPSVCLPAKHCHKKTLEKGTALLIFPQVQEISFVNLGLEHLNLPRYDLHLMRGVVASVVGLDDISFELILACKEGAAVRHLSLLPLRCNWASGETEEWIRAGEPSRRRGSAPTSRREEMPKYVQLVILILCSNYCFWCCIALSYVAI